MVIGTPLAGEGRPHVAAHDGGVPSGGDRLGDRAGLESGGVLAAAG